MTDTTKNKAVSATQMSSKLDFRNTTENVVCRMREQREKNRPS